jgi:hypothetical protein
MKMLCVPLIALCLISTAVSQNEAPTKTTELTGEIRADGKPLEKGRILFYSGNGQIVGCIIRDGKYKIEKPNTGQQTVTIDGQVVAAKYGESEISGLVVVVEKDTNNRFDFDLTSK